LRKVLVGCLSVAALTAGGLATTGTANAASGWNAVAQCESGGDPSTNTGNGYYGLYQFTRSTWASVGGSGLPSNASAAEQTRRAEKLYAQQGPNQWPVCGTHLSGSARVSRSYSRSAISGTVTHHRRHRHVSSVVSHPRHHRHYSPVSSQSRHHRHHWLRGTAVLHLQQRLNRHGAGLAEDGIYGPLTAAAAGGWHVLG
jgi:hypothetical protein